MLKLYDKNHNFIGRILKYSDCKKESEAATGDATLSFTYLAGSFDIQNEYYVQTKDAEYVVKEVSGSRMDGQEIVAVLNLEDLEQNAFQEFSVTDATIEEAARLFLAGTSWRVGECMVTKRRNAGMRQVDARQGILKLCTAFMCEPVFDTKNKTVSFYEEVGEDKGVYFLKGLNLRKLSKTQTSYDFYTRIIPIGADGLTIEGVNGGVNYLENHQYSDKIRTMIWQDDSYTDAQALMEDAEKKLDDLSKPVVEYAADIIDLAAQKPEYGILSYRLGDTVTLIDQDTVTREKQRIRKITEYEQEPEKNTCELGNTVLTFEELQDKLQAAAEIVGYTMTSDGKIHVSDILKWEEGVAGSQAVQGLNSSVSALNGQYGALSLLVGTINANYLSAEEASLKYADIERLNAAEATVHSIQGDYAEFKSTVTDELSAQTALIDEVLAKTVTTDYLEAHYATIESLNAANAAIENLKANQITAEYLETNYAAIEDLNATNAEIDALKASQITTDYLEANYATVKDLNATNATVGSLSAKEAAFETATAENFEAQTATINELKAGMITADYLKANYAAIDLANIKDGCITTAMIGEGVVGTAQIADGSITDAKIVGLTANKITAGRLDAAEIEVVNLNAANITVGTINGQQIAPGAIDLSNLADGLSSTITNTAEDVKQALEDAGLAQSAAEAASEAATKAQTAAEGASSAASKAQSTADIASTAASKAQSTADSANTAAGKAQSAADAANTAAGKAQNAAESAQSTANTAQSTADAAKTAASTAQSTADAAKTAASTAQTTADGKNTVFYQAAAPAITGRKVNDVWFDTDDANRMYYFDGKAWTAKQFGGNAIAASSVTASHLVANAVTAGKIAAGAVTSGTIAANAVTAGTIAAGAVSADQLAANAVTAGKIAANAVTTATIAAGAVNADKIATNAVTADKVNAGAITTDKLAANAVTAAKMAAKTITANSGVIADAAITNAMIANLAVTAAKIADATITNAKIANGTIENGKIKDATITNAKIADATIESAKIKALDAAKITTGTLAAARIGAGTIDATKLSVSTLSAITANLGTVTAGTIRSATYTYSSGNYSTSGMEINLTGAGYIRAKNFAIDASGNTYFKGTVDATTLKIKDTIQMYRDEWVTSAGYKTVLSVDNGIALHVGNSGMPTYIEGAGTFDIKEALFGATIHMGYGSNYDFISSTGGAFGIHTAITIDGGVTSNGNMYVTSDSYARRFITPNHSTSWINAIWGNAAVNVYEAGASGGFNAIASIKATSGAWTIGALNADNCFYIGYGTETRYGNGSNGLDHLYKFGTNGAIYVNGTAVSLSNHTHSYLPLSGGTVTGNFYFKGYNGSSRMPVQSETTANARVDYLGAHSNNVFRVCGQFGAAGYTNHNITAPSSDIRLKTNIALTNVEAMPTLMKMRVCQFDWIDGRTDNHQNIGFIADQLEQIDGKLAVGGGYDEDGVINIKSVDTFYMLGYVVKGIQELAVELTAVKRDIGARVTAQESQIEQLRSQLAQAYARIAVLENKVQMRSAG